MREIKFRAWDQTQRKMLYGDKFTNHLEELLRNKPMQYTGLKDKNGVEIWEGDVIRMSPNRAIGIVSWDTRGYWGVELDGIVYSFASGTDITAHSSKVIGNIYENPELLEAA